LGEVAEQCLGKMLDAKKNKGHPCFYLRNPNVRWFEVDVSDLKEMPFESHELERYGLKSGDVVICEGGDAGRAAIWDERLPDIKFQKAIHRVRVGPELFNRFLVYRLMADHKSGRLAEYYTGATMKHLTGRDLSNYSFELPPMAEQYRIVSIFDQVQQLKMNCCAAIENLELLARSSFIELFGSSSHAPVTIGDCLEKNPNGWGWELLTDVARLATGHTPDRKKPEYWGGDIPWLSLTDIRSLDLSVAQTTGECTTQAGIDNSSSVKLSQGTVCFSRTASIGFVTLMGREMATSQDFFNWVCGDRLDPVYLMYALFLSRSRLRLLSNGSTHKTIYFPTAESFRVLVPPIELQKKFALQIASIEKVRSVQKLRLSELDALFASLQHRAFRGEL
jgi:type I restriction enzyme S subunit